MKNHPLQSPPRVPALPNGTGSKTREILQWVSLCCPHPAPGRIFSSPHTTGHSAHSCTAAKCPYNAPTAVSKVTSTEPYTGEGSKQQQCNPAILPLFGAGLSSPFPIPLFHPPHDSCKGWITGFIFYNPISLPSDLGLFGAFFNKASDWSFKARVIFWLDWRKIMWGRKGNYINYLNLHSNSVLPPRRSRKTSQV